MISIVLDRKYAEIKDIEGKKVICQYIILKDGVISENKKEEVLGNEKKKIVPTDIGMVVNEFMETYFANLIDVNYTNKLEEKLDLIANNQLESTEVLKEINNYIDSILQNIQKKDSSFKDNYKRDLGFYPKTQNMVSCYIGKYGPVLCLFKKGEVKNKLCIY